MGHGDTNSGDDLQQKAVWLDYDIVAIVTGLGYELAKGSGYHDEQAH